MGMMVAAVNQTWNPEFYSRIHDMTPADLAKWLSWISPTAGLLGAVVASISCAFIQRITKTGHGLVIFISSLFVLPFALGALLVDNHVISFACFFFAGFVRNFFL
jgi:hypothetical protein